MKGLRWLLVMSALAVAACDGGPKSPDFEPETTISDFRIAGPAPATAELGPQSVPVGATRDVRALATITTTVPPGYTGTPAPVTVEGRQVVRLQDQDVTTDTSWSSSPDTVAGVDGNGRITGKVQGNTTITASYKGKSDTLAVTVTSATLAGGSVECIRPTTTAAPSCPTSDVYSRTPGIDVTFEAIGRFSDGQLYRIANPPHTLAWTSTVPTVAANTTAASSTFRTDNVGSTVIAGEVTGGVTPLPVPASADATLNVTAANEFCDTEFPAGSQILTETCLGCSVSDGDPSRITDANLETFATLNIPLGLLTLSNVSVTVVSPTTILSGSPVGFLLSRTTNDILAAQLLGSLEVVTLRREGANLVEIDDPATNSEVLRLTLLGIRLPEAPQFLLTTGNTTQNYDAVKLTFRGGLLSLLAAVNVNTACSRARPATP
ncbi:Ig-like domain-containing protein [Solimonas sp. SE-A11]|uniref:Ig-like domain-containing protein n=1 Tax=Solimonas sp. SE-A11 TaxID=3054954 RepID=UPI00259D1942|nr:Ig-like domain-containing protein [Solimonas sp. SE-A11]MDM4771759.1 Ig-like domain-containing protein [Solimonas sp. SE-A11]